MKRNFVIATLVALMLVAGLVATVSAQTAQPTTPAGACANGNFVDEDKDGVCDNAPRDGSGMQYGQQNGQGMNRGRGQGQGMQGSGTQNGQGQGIGQGANFVDENKDGVCDNFGTMQGSGRNGQGMRQGRGMQGQGMHGHGMQGRGMQGPQGWNN